MRAIGALCQDAGLRVVEASGWADRGRTWATLKPEYVVVHHTASAVDIDRLLIDGRSDLPGPLCSFALHADGTVVLIASGLANHCGVATISSDQAYGIEATGPIPAGNTGQDAFPNYQAYVTLVAAIRIHHGWPEGRVVAHKEIARPDGRKPDPAFGSVFPAPYPDMTTFRAQVERRVTTWGTTEEDNDMPTPKEVEDAVYQALKRFTDPGGIIPGQDAWADYPRVLADREAKILAATGETNRFLGQLVELLTPPPEPPPEPPA